MKLLLFDIDGTLIRSHGAGRTALIATLKEMFGTAGPVENYQMSGKTDPRIIIDLLTAAGIPPDTIHSQLPAIYERLTEHAQHIFPRHKIEPCPGVPELLTQLHQHPNTVLGLLTGNINTTAPLKLRAAGLDPNLFAIGAYGSDAIDRNQLPAIAMRRASELTGHEFTGNNTVIIGDTPADILCARAGRATAVAVASGWHAATTLARYQPDHLLENLTNTEHVIQILLNHHS
ncbi:MAG: HAD family hydrolase [Chloroflexi bacterium]|nr:MAG: HAD family hydrolase [Chloroflexota bacterium]